MYRHLKLEQRLEAKLLDKKKSESKKKTSLMKRSTSPSKQLNDS
jgi:hypothetical protein